MANDVPNRAHNSKRKVGNYEISYGLNEHTGSPEAVVNPIGFGMASKAKDLRTSVSSLFDTDVVHGTRGTMPPGSKSVRKHIEKTLPKMGK